MADTLDLDAISVKRFKVQKLIDGEIHEWILNDRISTGVTIWVAAMGPALNQLTDPVTITSSSAIRKAQDEVEERTFYLCLELFRNGYPDTDEDWLRSAFTHDERWEIVQHFFTIRGAALATVSVSGASDPATPKEKSKKVKHTPTAVAPGTTGLVPTRVLTKEERLEKALSD